MARMAYKRQRWCAQYQNARPGPGQSACPNPARLCPLGRHGCSTCYTTGHGAANCHADVPPAPWTLSSGNPDVSNTGRKGGFKGEGAKGNYGVPIPVPELVTLQKTTQGTSSSSSGAPYQTSPRPVPTPLPKGCPQYETPSPEKIDQWVKDNFTPMTNLSSEIPPRVGQQVLWRGMKKGRSGGDSTKVEYFNGTVHEIEK